MIIKLIRLRFDDLYYLNLNKLNKLNKLYKLNK